MYLVIPGAMSSAVCACPQGVSLFTSRMSWSGRVCIGVGSVSLGFVVVVLGMRVGFVVACACVGLVVVVVAGFLIVALRCVRLRAA